MTVLIASSTEDPASTNIKNSLLEKSDWKKIDTMFQNPVYRNKNIEDIMIVTMNDRTIKHENLDKEVEKKIGKKIDQAIFVSRHRSKSGEPTLTTHPIGNFGKGEFGGKSKTLCKSSPRLMTELLRIMNKNSKREELKHQICFEVTHHGPNMEAPTFFAEVGSTKEEWNKKRPAEIVAESLIELLRSYRYEKDMSNSIPVLLGIGGGHYAPRFTDVALNKKAAFGHMIPSYQIKEGNINEKILDKAILATPNVESVYLHKKALKKSEVTKYKNLFKKKGIPVISSKSLPSL